MVDFGLNDVTTVLPTHADVAEWVIDSYYLGKRIVQNAWLKGDYSWFERTGANNDTNDLSLTLDEDNNDDNFDIDNYLDDSDNNTDDSQDKNDNDSEEDDHVLMQV